MSLRYTLLWLNFIFESSFLFKFKYINSEPKLGSKINSLSLTAYIYF